MYSCFNTIKGFLSETWRNGKKLYKQPNTQDNIQHNFILTLKGKFKKLSSRQVCRKHFFLNTMLEMEVGVRVLGGTKTRTFEQRGNQTGQSLFRALWEHCGKRMVVQK